MIFNEDFFDKMNFLIAIPEIIMVGSIIILVLACAVLKNNSKIIPNAIIFVMLVLIGTQINIGIDHNLFGYINQIKHINHHYICYGFNTMFVLDGFGMYAKIMLYTLTIFVVLYLEGYFALHRVGNSFTDWNNKICGSYSMQQVSYTINSDANYRAVFASSGNRCNQFYLILCFIIFGSMILISANNLITAYLGLEILSLAICGQIAIDNRRLSLEAAIKFFILSALSSGILLYGISLIYGLSGGLLNFQDLSNFFANYITFYSKYATLVDSSQQIASLNQNIIKMIGESAGSAGMLYYSQGTHLVIIIALIFILAAVAFKLGLAPFHMWLVDLYDGSSHASLTIIATITKIASLALIIRLLLDCSIDLFSVWSNILIVFACISLFIGNVFGITQNRLKRLFGYSAIANMGFIALIPALLGNPENGNSTLLFNQLNISSVSLALNMTFIYVFNLLTIFGVLLLFGVYKQTMEINDLSGIGKYSPLGAFILLISTLSLAGIPPLIGFYPKFLVIKAAMNYNILLGIYIIMMSLIGIFYYLKIIKAAYFNEDKSNINYNITCIPCATKIARFFLLVSIAIILLLSIMPEIIFYVG